MIPSEIDGDSPESERWMYGRLRDCLPDSWTVIHGRRFLIPASDAKHSAEGEVDFLVLDPERGYLALEVKGGGVERTRDGWFSEDRHGERHAIRDPGEQASRAVRQIDRYLAQRPWFQSNRTRIRFGWGVALTDVDAPAQLGPDLPRQAVIDRADLADPKAALDRVFGSQVAPGAPVSPAAQQAFVESLAPCFRLVPSLAGRIERERAELVRLTDEQASVLDLLDAWPRAAIEGGAGTGKTVLAMTKARGLAADGRRVLLLCFNRPLADHLAARAEGFDVNTFHGLSHDLCEEAEIPFEVPDEARAARTFWEEEAPDLLIQALGRLPERRYDALVVDEGQDFRENWWIALEDCLREPRSGTLYAFFDPNQKLYRGGGPPAALGVAPTRLRWNCRNTAAIAEYAAGLLDLRAEVRPGAPVGSPVEEISCDGPDEAVAAVRRLLHRYVVKGGVPPEQVAVLSTHTPEKSCLWGRRLGSFALAPLEEAEGRRICFTSLHRFKGLEADVVILCDVEPGAFTSRPAFLYVAASRARHVLAVIRIAPA